MVKLTGLFSDIAKLTLAVQIDHLRPEDISILGVTAIKLVEQNKEAKEKKKREQQNLEQALYYAFNDYIQRLDFVIAETEERIRILNEERKEAERLSREAFDRMHEAERLLDAVRDNQSLEAERKKLINLLGEKAKNVSLNEIRDMLEEHQDKEHGVGLKHAKNVTYFDEQIINEEKNLKRLTAEREKYKSAKPTEEKLAIYERDGELSEFKTPDTKADQQDLIAPDFKGL